MPTYTFTGTHTVVLTGVKGADGSTVVGVPGTTVETAEAVKHPLLAPVKEKAPKVPDSTVPAPPERG